MIRPPTEWRRSLQIAGVLVLISATAAAVGASMARHHRIDFVDAGETDGIKLVDGKLDERPE
jgi:hypothetical protein